MVERKFTSISETVWSVLLKKNSENSLKSLFPSSSVRIIICEKHEESEKLAPWLSAASELMKNFNECRSIREQFSHE